MIPALVCGMLAAGAALAAEAPDIQEIDDVVYAKRGDEDLELTLYQPAPSADPSAKKTEALRPGMVLIHGGGWVAGWRGQMDWFGEQLAKEGFVCVAFSYRLMPGDAFPAPIEDAKAAVRWFREHAEAYGVDPNRIGVLGQSAGGQIAGLLATTDDDVFSDGASEVSAAVQCAVLMYGAVDLTQWRIRRDGWYFGRGSHKYVHEFVNRNYDGDGDPYAWASPLSHVGPDTAPTLLITGDKDILVSPKQSRKYYEALKEAGVEAVMVTLKGANHGFDHYNFRCRRKAYDEILPFLQRHLGNEVPAEFAAEEE